MLRRGFRPILFDGAAKGLGNVSVSTVSTTSSLWQSNVLPALFDNDDLSAIVVGTRIQSSSAGTIDGIRWYKKGTANGVHTVSLWSNAGTLLASKVVTGETLSGWQKQLFDTPVSISANTTYVASFHTTDNLYQETPSYFNSDVVNDLLTGLATAGTPNFNGVYNYSATNVFPNQDGGAASYFIDVVFSKSTAGLTYSTDFKSAANGVSTAITSNALSVNTGDFITIAVTFSDNADCTAWTVSNTAGTPGATAITWTKQAETDTIGSSKVVLWSGVAGVIPPNNVTVTATAGAQTNDSKAMFVIVSRGAHTTNPLPAGNIFPGSTNVGTSTQAITPTSVGSALWMVASDWNATNSFAPIANCTAGTAYNEAGFQTVNYFRPTVNPRTDAAAFTIGETNTPALVSWIAFEIQAAALNNTNIAGNVVNVATATGNLTAPSSTALAGNATSVSTNTGAITSSINIVGSSVSVALTTGALSKNLSMSGAATSVSTDVGALSKNLSMSGALGTIALTIGTLSENLALSESAAAQSTATGQLGISENIGGGATAVTTDTGTLSTSSIVPISGQASALATDTGVLSENLSLSGSASSVATDTGTLNKNVPISGQASALATDTGVLSENVPLTGNVGAIATDTGSVSISKTLTGSASSLATDTGTLSASSVASISGQASSVTTDTGTLSESLPMIGNAGAIATDTGAVSISKGIAGSEQAVASATGTLSGAGSMYAGGTSTSSATGSLSIIEGITGSAAAVSVSNGILNKSLALSGLAAANAIDSGVITQGVTLSGAAVSITTDNGIATLSVTLSGSDLATAALAGTSNISIALSGSALSSALATANITVVSPGSLAGGATSVGSATGAIKPGLQMSGAATAFASIAGGVSTILNASGVTTGVSNLTGNLVVTIATTQILGNIAASSIANGLIKLSIPLSGASLVSALAQATLSGGLQLKTIMTLLMNVSSNIMSINRQGLSVTCNSQSQKVIINRKFN